MTSAVRIPPHGSTGGRTAVAARARQVVKAYGTGETRVVALDHVDVDIARGQFTAIMGPSGSGKSTLMHCLAGLDTVTSGQIFLDETEITGLKDKKLTQLRRDRIGFIFQAFNLLPTLNALENITLPMDIAGRGYDRAWLERVVETVGLAGRLKHRPTQLSGGQQQRVAIARALAMRPKVLLLDEVTSALDPELVAGVLDLLRDIARTTDITMLCVTHEMNFARDISDQVLMFDSGRVIEAGAPEKIFSEPEHDRTREFLSAVL